MSMSDMVRTLVNPVEAEGKVIGINIDIHLGHGVDLVFTYDKSDPDFSDSEWSIMLPTNVPYSEEKGSGQCGLKIKGSDAMLIYQAFKNGDLDVCLIMEEQEEERESEP
jgi:hypothetical protein